MYFVLAPEIGSIVCHGEVCSGLNGFDLVLTGLIEKLNLNTVSQQARFISVPGNSWMSVRDCEAVSKTRRTV